MQKSSEDKNDLQPMTGEYTIEARRLVKESRDHCTLCGEPFANERTTHLGYSVEGELIYTGDCCKKYIASTIVRHHHTKRRYTVPSDETILWRFMDFTKFLHLLETQQLFFAKPAQFNDPFEGAMGSLKNKEKWDLFYLAWCAAVQLKPPPGYEQELDAKTIVKHARRLHGQISEIGKNLKETTLINCWHENPFESEAMWKLYTQHLSTGIAIQTTYKDLYWALGRDPKFDIGRVNYIDFQSQFADLNGPHWYKRKSFEHEKEVRVIKRFGPNEEISSQLFDVDLTMLINKIYISPTADTWFIELVTAIVKRFNFSFTVEKSAMNDQPFF